MADRCAEIRLRAERRAGQMLSETPKQRPGEYQRSHDVTVGIRLADLGVSKMQSHRWGKIADVPADAFES